MESDHECNPHAALLKHFTVQDGVMEAALQQVQFHLEASKTEGRKATCGQHAALVLNHADSHG
jgi:hypothetical protein